MRIPEDERCESRFLQEQETNRLMKKHNTIEGFKFKKGEVYMLHTDNPDCPNDSSLWALISESDEDALRIESCSTNLRTFTLWKPLPTEYKYCRLTTRVELREFISNYAYYEALQSCR